MNPLSVHDGGTKSRLYYQESCTESDSDRRPIEDYHPGDFGVPTNLSIMSSDSILSGLSTLP